LGDSGHRMDHKVFGECKMLTPTLLRMAEN
jgi:hypothetical protein